MSCKNPDTGEGHVGELSGAQYVLSCICCFSKFCWLIPLVNKTAENIGRLLLERVFLDMAMFPIVVRTDNDPSFTSQVIASINKMMNIRHVFGATYHPQSQGQVENLHRTLTVMLRKMMDEPTGEWEARLPYAEAILSITPLRSLEGRNPYQVITGLMPKLPRVFNIKGGRVGLNMIDYVRQLIDYCTETYKEVKRIQHNLQEESHQKQELSDRLSAEFFEGDLVMIKQPPTRPRKGPHRFEPRVRPTIWKIKKKISPHSFRLSDPSDDRAESPYVQSAENLIKVNLPDLEMTRAPSANVELFEPEQDEWKRYQVAGYNVEGMVRLQPLVENEGFATLLTSVLQSLQMTSG